MPIFKDYIYPDHEVGVWKIDESFDELLQYLPDNGHMYMDELNSFTSETRRMEYLAVRVLLFRLLKEEKRILYHSNGKPYLMDSSMNISISHTQKYVAVIVSSIHPVGIDIEKQSERINKVASKFLNPEEDIYDNPEETTVKRLLIWSAKETMFKSLDESEIDFRDHLKIESFPLEQCFINAQEFKTDKKIRFVIPYIIYNDFVMTWTVRN